MEKKTSLQIGNQTTTDSIRFKPGDQYRRSTSGWDGMEWETKRRFFEFAGDKDQLRFIPYTSWIMGVLFRSFVHVHLMQDAYQDNCTEITSNSAVKARNYREIRRSVSSPLILTNCNFNLTIMMSIYEPTREGDIADQFDTKYYAGVLRLSINLWRATTQQQRVELRASRSCSWQVWKRGEYVSASVPRISYQKSFPVNSIASWICLLFSKLVELKGP